jgi:hypothetical protein
VAVTFQRTTLAAHMKRKSDTLCHAEIPGLLCSSLIDLPYSTLSLEKKGKFFHDDETFALVTDTRLVVNRATIASTWRSTLERHSLSTSHPCYSWPYPLRQATDYIARNPRNRQAHTACHPITVYAPPKRHNELGTTQSYPINCLYPPFFFPRHNFCRCRHRFPFSRSLYCSTLRIRKHPYKLLTRTSCNWSVHAETTGAILCATECRRWTWWGDCGFLPWNAVKPVVV